LLKLEEKKGIVCLLFYLAETGRMLPYYYFVLHKRKKKEGEKDPSILQRKKDRELSLSLIAEGGEREGGKREQLSN